jgi:hypothetical protein
MSEETGFVGRVGAGAVPPPANGGVFENVRVQQLGAIIERCNPAC